MSPDKIAPAPLLPGAQLIRHLGSGGFADVYLYEQEIPHRNVAVKVQRSSGNIELDKAFRAEVNLVARLSSHPAVVSVHDAGVTSDGRQYLVMEYCPPPSISGRIRMRTFSVSDVLDMGIRLSGALAALHSVNILHRDIKPANILLTEFGHPVLTDFGLALSVTEPKLRAGRGFSVPWAPPEQHVDQSQFDVTGDVYSLAATLYTMLAGRAPFEVTGGDNSELAMIARVMKLPLPPIERDDVPGRLELVFAKAMAKKPADRYQTIIEFAEALQEVQRILGQRVTPIDLFPEGYVSGIGEQETQSKTRRAIAVLAAQEGRDSEYTQRARFIQPSETNQMRSPTVHDGTFEHSPNTHNRVLQRDVAARTALTIVLLVVVAVLAAMALRSLDLFGRELDPSLEQPIDLAPVTPQVSLTGLQGERQGDGVRFWWNPVDEEEVDYLYKVLDPLDSHEVRQTKQPSVVVQPEPGQTCLEVVARFQDGRSTNVVSTCVKTP